MQNAVSRLALLSVFVVALAPAGAFAQTITNIGPTSSSSSAVDAIGAPLTLTVFGSSFSTADQIEVGGRDCPKQSQDPVQIVCTLPEGEGAGLPVDLVGPDGSIRSTSPQPFSYFAPSLDLIAPSSAPTAGGSIITLQGSSFGLSPSVLIGPSLCGNLVRDGHTQLICQAPAGEGAELPVRVVAGGQSSDGTPTFSYDPPSIDTVAPSSGPTSGGNLITITGSSFGASPSVRVGGSSCPLSAPATSSEVVCTAPPGQGASVAVEVSTAGGQRAQGTYGYDAPSLLSVSPSSSPTSGGVLITITGTNFGVSPSATMCGSPAAVVNVTPSALRVLAPVGEGASCPVSVSVAGQLASLSSGFGYDPPSIESVSPSSAPSSGGVPITIHGESFGLSASVSVGGLSCPVTGNAGDAHRSVVCTLPAGQGAGREVVISSSGQSSSASPGSSFSYAAPSISSVTPSSGPRAGGVTLTIQGSSFGLSPAVSVGQASCPLSSSSHTSIECVLPPGGGDAAVVVAVEGQVSSSSLFSYDPVVCPAGSSSSDGDTCQACPAGTFASEEGSTVCTPCAPGHSQSLTGATSCDPCVEGSAQASPGQSSCDFCAPGTFSDSTGRSTCQLCTPGTFQEGAGQVSCSSCPACADCPGAACGLETGVCPSGGVCPVCGDRAIASGEECDDGNTEVDDGCSSACEVEEGFTCTYADDVGSHCLYTAGCGDGVKDAAEGCEDGNALDGDGCSSLCALEPGWQCVVDADGSTDACAELFGDGLVVGGERCDDGNDVSGDGCHEGAIEGGFACDDELPSLCIELVDCGNGAIDPPETCDDGDRSGGDGCSTMCTIEAGWACADGGLGACTELSGDGLVVGAERCDDGNDVSGDGCDDGVIETGYACDGSEPSLCLPLLACGDGALQVGEECDDGNTDDGDGCSAFCRREGAPDDADGGQADGGTDGDDDGCACAEVSEGPARLGGVLLLGLCVALGRRRPRARG